MTLVAAWIRNVRSVRELVVASDSRLSGAAAVWDCSPKIISLPRTDALMAFAGSTDLAYPTMLQVVRAIEAHPASVERRYDVTDLSDKVLQVMNQMLDIRVVDRVARAEAMIEKAGTEYLLGGWSWRHERFTCFRYTFDSGTRRYIRSKIVDAQNRRHRYALAFLGSGADAARSHFMRGRSSQGKTASDPIDMEPLEVLRDLIREGTDHTLGGAPQVVKVYRHMNTESFGVIWRNRVGEIGVPTYGGRPLLEWEKPYFQFIDADAPERHATYVRRLDAAGVERLEEVTSSDDQL